MIKKFFSLVSILSLSAFGSAALAGSCCSSGCGDDAESDASVGQTIAIASCGCGGGDEA